jgi:hypothetical protein
MMSSSITTDSCITQYGPLVTQKAQDLASSTDYPSILTQIGDSLISQMMQDSVHDFISADGRVQIISFLLTSAYKDVVGVEPTDMMKSSIESIAKSVNNKVSSTAQSISTRRCDVLFRFFRYVLSPFMSSSTTDNKKSS